MSASVMVALGFAPGEVAVVGVVRFYWVCFIHCDIAFDLGPLNHEIATPGFHRWHHVTGAERNVNFAGFFSCIDHAFGTFHLPRDRHAVGFSVEAPVVPAKIHGPAFGAVPLRPPALNGRRSQRIAAVAPV